MPTTTEGNRVPSEQLRDAQTHFVELMAELFQLDEAEALDFGIYRVIRHRNRAVRSFLGSIETHGDHKQLVGGELQRILEDEFAATAAEAVAQMDAQLRALERDLGLQRHMDDAAREAKLTELINIPAVAAKVRQYRALAERRVSATHGGDDRLEVLNRLHQFFDRHYQDGDFIVQRRYGRDAQRYIRSTGEDTEFRWATEDMYYIKSGDIFTDWPVKLPHGTRIVFAVDKGSLTATRKELKPTDKTHYELKALKQEDDGWRLTLSYLKGASKKTHEKAIVDALRAKTREDEDEIRRWLKRYAARNQSDFFIHKRLGEALTEELDIFLKTDVLDAGQLLAGDDRSLRHARVARSVRNIGRQIIAFLAALEDFQKQLWEKKKLVLETRYIITLDRIEKLAGRDWLEARMPEIVKRQKTEWHELGLGEYKKAKDCERKAEGGLFPADASKYLPLPLDTGNFDGIFKWDLLAAIHGVSDELDGILIHSDNWQALNTIRTRFASSIDCIYIDPPYNAPASIVPYKNSYKDASWVSMMQCRVAASRSVIDLDAPYFIAIDDWELTNLDAMLARELSRMRRDVIVVNHHPQGSGGDNVSRTHEYMIALCPPDESVLYTLVDADGEEWPYMRSGTGENNFRAGRFRSFYAILVDPTRSEIVGVEDPPSKGADYPRDPTPEGLRRIYPIGGDGRERVWRLSGESGKRAFKNSRLRVSNSGTIYLRVGKKKSPVFSNWTDSRYNAGLHGTSVIESLFGSADAFAYPKSIYLVRDAIATAMHDRDGYVLDYFAGSGTTAHAVMQLNAQRTESADDDDELGARIKFVVAEANEYARTVILPRLKKVAASANWSLGIAGKLDGGGVFFAYYRLEQYEDTLESLAIDPEPESSDELDFEDAATLLRWRLDGESKRVYCAVDRFRSPFGYRLRRAQGVGPAEPVEVDLVESLIWLLGLDVDTLRREIQGVAITGKNRRGESVLVAFRDCDSKGSGDWVLRQMAAHAVDRYYTNDPADLAFEGAEKLESIEAVFATQFGGVA